MPTLALREIVSTTRAPAMPRRATTEAERSDRSLQGVLIFSAIGFTLMVLAAVFSLLQLPPPVF